MLIEVEVLVVIEDDVANPTVILIRRTSLEVPGDDLLEVEVWLDDQLFELLVDVLDVH